MVDGALCPLTMRRLNGRGRAGPTPGIILGRGPIVQTPMHATLILKPNPLRRDRIPLRERVKEEQTDHIKRVSPEG